MDTLLSWTMMVVYSRDNELVGMAHSKITQKPPSIFPDNDGALLVW